MRKIPVSLILLGSLIVGVGLVAVATMTGVLPMRNILTGFYTFVFGLVVISILAIIGAVFFGMYISHRIFSTRQFTTFEEEMLKMKDDVQEIKKKLEEKDKKN
ncbi:MAG: hypothetical protein ACOC53_00155 [Candidatus Saliniplasma sp.]